MDIAASSLYLSKETAVKSVDEIFIVICKDDAGQPVTWKGPKGRLGTRTHPKVHIGSYGTSIIFNRTRVEDSGNYTCSVPTTSKSGVFRLVVEGK
ncbi:hypothetical protein NQ314_013711 [Rhamnusium bicolor]|uniref:Immunoglobulin-like beta-sandwich domain-containing protein n=1 Tax=Rhamnusium bicolor TaxID=1586634 RepID=A0AAV8X4Q6_9CUCU|nr:hypothetical protein NQ314_013711 [Rhamnusium bicolor]